jgi:hypothetical protein
VTRSFTEAALLELLRGDREVVEQLVAMGFLPEPSETSGYSEEDAEHARVAHLLLRELEVNWPGVEVILRLRAELLVTRRTLAQMVQKQRKP